MKSLVVEDGFAQRKYLQEVLLPYGKCDVAVDGEEALEAFELAWKEEEPYNLICLDIMMPGIDGQQVLKEIRKREIKMKLKGLDRVKIIMTTALGDKKNIMESFMSECESYIVKPVKVEKLIEEMKGLGLLKKNE